MNIHTHFLRKISLWIVIISLTACTSENKSQPTVSSPTQTLTPTLTVTATSTLQPSPTVTETPEPSPTPAGFFSHFSAGFSVTYPTTWNLVDQNARQLSLEDQSGGVFVLMESYAEKEAKLIEEVVEKMEDQFGENGRLEIKDSYDFELSDGVIAERAEVSVKADSRRMDLWVVYVHQNQRAYSISIFGNLDSLVSRQATLDRVLKSVRLYAPQPLGMPREETLALLGGEPEAEDLDPAKTEAPSGGYVGLLFSGLVRLTPDMQVVPDLAEKWTISPDGVIYTFTLRDDLMFSSGEPITAEHVRKSWERALDPEIESKVALTYLGDILGAKERYSGEAEEIQGLKVIDEQTLTVTLDGSKSYFLAKLTYPTAAVYETGQTEADTEDWVFSADSSGPYQLKEYREAEGLIFERNLNYHQPASVPYIVYLFDPGGEPVSNYEEGTIDLLALSSEEIHKINVPEDPLNAELVTTPSMCTDIIRLNSNLAPLDDPQVRKALLLATDRAAMIEKLSKGVSLPANGVLPPAMPGAQADRVLPGFDPQAAKEALAQSTYTGQGIEITLNASGFADSQRDDVAMLVGMWQQNLGIRVKVEYLDPENYTELASDHPGHALIYGWCADYPDPENFLDVLFHSESSFNIARTSHQELDDLLEQARTEPDPGKRLVLYQQAEDFILGQILVIPLQYGVRGMLVKPYLKGFVLSPANAQALPLVELEGKK